jgi:hypothetical protein
MATEYLVTLAAPWCSVLSGQVSTFNGLRGKLLPSRAV